MESSGYRVLKEIAGSGKYRLLLIERAGRKYVARVASEAGDLFEMQYCKEISSCPNVAVPEFLDENLSIAVRKYLPKTLRDLLDTSGLDDVEALNIALSICRALECIHSKDLVYTDLKPENVGIENGQAFLIDTDSITRPFSRPRFITLDYAPPEYHEWGIVVKESDLYQLGLVLIEMSRHITSCIRSELQSLASMLTKRNPFDRPSARVVASRIELLIERLS